MKLGGCKGGGGSSSLRGQTGWGAGKTELELSGGESAAGDPAPWRRIRSSMAGSARRGWKWWRRTVLGGFATVGDGDWRGGGNCGSPRLLGEGWGGGEENGHDGGRSHEAVPGARRGCLHRVGASSASCPSVLLISVCAPQPLSSPSAAAVLAGPSTLSSPSSPFVAASLPVRARRSGSNRTWLR